MQPAQEPLTEAAAELLDRAVNEVRRISKNLRPSELDDFGLLAAVEELLEEFRKRAGVNVEFKRTAAATGADGDDAAACDLQRSFRGSSRRAVFCRLQSKCRSRCSTSSFAAGAKQDRARLIFCEKILDREFAEVGQGAAQRLVVPVPPCELGETPGDTFRKAPLDRPRRIARDDRVSRDILGHD